MIGALKCPASGVRMLRNAASPTNGGASSFEAFSTFSGDRSSTMNWSQKRFLRCLPPSSSLAGTGNINQNAQYIITEIENQHKRLTDLSDYENKVPNSNRSLAKKNYRRSIRGHQSHLWESLSDAENKGNKNNHLVAEMYKIIIENGPPTVRVKNIKDDSLLKEWIGIQNELSVIKRDRIEEDKRRLQIAGQQVLREMEASLRKGMNLEDLDEAIEGALCSELKDQ